MVTRAHGSNSHSNSVIVQNSIAANHILAAEVLPKEAVHSCSAGFLEVKENQRPFVPILADYQL